MSGTNCPSLRDDCPEDQGGSSRQPEVRTEKIRSKKFVRPKSRSAFQKYDNDLNAELAKAAKKATAV